MVKVEAKRAFGSWRIPIAATGVFATFFFGINGNFTLENSVLDIFYVSSSSVAFMLVFLFCAVPYAESFQEDQENGYIKYVLMRESIGHYVYSKLVMILFTSILVMGMGSLAFALYCKYKLSWVDDYMAEIIKSEGKFAEILSGSQPCIWFLLWGCMWGILCGIMAVIAAYLSLYIRNRLIVLAAPILCFQFVTEIKSDILRENDTFDLCFLYDMKYKVFSNSMVELVVAAAVAAMIIVVVGLLIIKRIHKGM